MAKRGSQQWKFNISKARGRKYFNGQTELVCPWCEGEGTVQNIGYVFRKRREEAGITQKEFIADSNYCRTTIQVVERGGRKPPAPLIDQYMKLPRKYIY